MTTYAIVKWNPGFDQARFGQCKVQGIHQTSFSTVRKSLDGKLAVLKWTGTAAQIPAAIGANLVATYDQAGILAEMAKPAWTQTIALAQPTMLARFAAAPKKAAVATASFVQRNKWKIAAATAAAAGIGSALYYYFT